MKDLKEELGKLDAISNYEVVLNEVVPLQSPECLLGKGEILFVNKGEALVIDTDGEVHVLCKHGSRKKGGSWHHTCCW